MHELGMTDGAQAWQVIVVLGVECMQALFEGPGSYDGLQALD
jgi:hypothetical protein